MTKPSSRVHNSLEEHIENTVYKQFANSLQQAMDAHNLPGFDLYEFHQIFKQAVGQGKSEREAFKKSVFASKVMRISRDSLVQNHDHYMKILVEEKKRFQADMNAFVKENMDGEVTESKLDAVESAFARAFGEITSELKGIRNTLVN